MRVSGEEATGCLAGPGAIALARGEPVEALEVTIHHRMTDSERARAIEELAQETGPLALGVALRMLGDRSSAEDALQDAFVQAYRGLDGFRAESTVRTWFLRIVVNSCRRHRRLLRRLVATREQVARAARLDGPSEPVGRDPLLRARLEEAVLRLPHRQRAAFVLRYGEHLSMEEVAAVMGCALGTSKATLHKAVARLRRELGDLA